MVYRYLHEKVVTSRHDHREMPKGSGLVNCVGSRPIPENCQGTIGCQDVMDCSA